MKPACTCHGPSMGPGQATCDQGGGHIWRRGQGVNQVTAQPVQGSVLGKGPRPCLTRPPPPGPEVTRGTEGKREMRERARRGHPTSEPGEDAQLPTGVHPDQGRRMWKEPGFKTHLRRIRGPPGPKQMWKVRPEQNTLTSRGFRVRQGPAKPRSSQGPGSKARLL